MIRKYRYLLTAAAAVGAAGRLTIGHPPALAFSKKLIYLCILNNQNDETFSNSWNLQRIA